MQIKKISVSKDFFEFPTSRSDGERFRRSFLVPALRKYDKVVVSLDGIKVTSNRFFTEAFGGLIEKDEFTVRDLKQKLIFESEQAGHHFYIKKMWEIVSEADEK